MIACKGSEKILLNVLDPNREAQPQYLTYVLTAKSGRVLTGMITAETANGVTIRRADQTSETVARPEIDELRGTGLSFMPEGWRSGSHIRRWRICWRI